VAAVGDEESKEGAMSMIETLTQRERQNLLFELLGSHVGPLRTADELAAQRGTAIYPIGGGRMVKPGEMASFQVRMNWDFKPYRLVILEPLYDRNERQTYEATQVVDLKRPWWAPWRPRTRTDVKQYERLITTRDQVAHRKLWWVHAFYIADTSQFQGAASLGGDVFAPDGHFDFDGSTCERGQDLTLQMSHEAPDPIPFVGLFVGQTARGMSRSAMAEGIDL
jgi:hypothetical protein